MATTSPIPTIERDPFIKETCLPAVQPFPFLSGPLPLFLLFVDPIDTASTISVSDTHFFSLRYTEAMKPLYRLFVSRVTRAALFDTRETSKYIEKRVRITSSRFERFLWTLEACNENHWRWGSFRKLQANRAALNAIDVVSPYTLFLTCSRMTSIKTGTIMKQNYKFPRY